MTREMVSIRRITNAAVDGIAEYGSAPKIGNVNPQVLVASTLNLLIKGIERDARFYEASARMGIDVEDLGHALAKIHDNTASDSGGSTAVADCRRYQQVVISVSRVISYGCDPSKVHI